MKKTILDKIIAGLIFAGSVAWYFIQNMTGFFTAHGLDEINDMIPLISCFSIFSVIWSFFWDQKLDQLYNQIKTYEAECLEQYVEVKEEHKKLIITYENEHKNGALEVKSELNKILSDIKYNSQQTESRILYEYETDLNNFLHLKPESSDYAQIYVITNDVDVESDDFGDVICKNIINNHQYVYMTPLMEEDFINKLKETLLRVKPNGIDRYLLDAAIHKNIRHIRNVEFFEILPDYSDMVIYQQKQQAPINNRIGEVHGYYSFQNDPIICNNIKYYYYSPMTNELARKVTKYIDDLLRQKGKVDLSSLNYITEKAEEKQAGIDMGNGLFCKETINEGDLIMKKGGRFILKKDLDPILLSNVKYIQVSKEYVVSSLTSGEDAKLGFPINHDCKRPNCCIKSAIEIVATKQINPGEQILIDYAYFDPDYDKFKCRQCGDNCDREGLTEVEVKQKLMRIDAKNFSPYLRDIIKGGKP